MGRQASGRASKVRFKQGSSHVSKPCLVQLHFCDFNLISSLSPSTWFMSTAVEAALGKELMHYLHVCKTVGRAHICKSTIVLQLGLAILKLVVLLLQTQSHLLHIATGGHCKQKTSSSRVLSAHQHKQQSLLTCETSGKVNEPPEGPAGVAPAAAAVSPVTCEGMLMRGAKRPK